MKRLAAILLVTILLLTGIVINGEMSLRSQKQPEAVTPQLKEPITANGLYIAINKERAKNNLQQFAHETQLDKSARLKCDDMVAGDYYGHNNPTTNRPGYKYIEDTGIKAAYLSENLNLGFFNTSDDVIVSWMNSEAHRASIVDPRYTQIGFAVCAIPSHKGQVVVVQHKIEPAKQTTQTIYRESAPQPTITNCTSSNYTSSYATYTTCHSY